MSDKIITFQNKEKPYKCPYCKDSIHNETLDGWYLCNKCKRKFNPKLIENPNYVWQIPKIGFNLVAANRKKNEDENINEL